MVVIAIVTSFILINRDPQRKKIVSTDQLSNLFILAIISGVIGGRFLHVIANWQYIESFGEIFAVWEGGLSVLGVILAIIGTLPFYLLYAHIPITPFFDMVTCYAPLLEGISRIGCFFAGCCYGMPSTLPWAVTYTCPDSLAPLGIPLHPTQLYTALSLALVFVLLRYILRPYCTVSGQITLLYFMFMGTIRFMMDFVRQDREYIGNITFLTLHQLIAGTIFIVAFLLFIIITTRAQRTHESV